MNFNMVRYDTKIYSSLLTQTERQGNPPGTCPQTEAQAPSYQVNQLSLLPILYNEESGDMDINLMNVVLFFPILLMHLFVLTI